MCIGRAKDRGCHTSTATMSTTDKQTGGKKGGRKDMVEGNRWVRVGGGEEGLF